MSHSEYRSLVTLAKKKHHQGERTTALKLVEYLVSEYPEQLEGWLLLARLSPPEQALEYLQEAKRLAPHHPRVRLAVARAKRKLKRSTSNRRSPEKAPTPDTQPVNLNPASPLIAERRSLVWVWTAVLTALLILLFIGIGTIFPGTTRADSESSQMQSADLSSSITTPTYQPSPQVEENIPPAFTPSSTPEAQAEPTATPVVLPNLYGCSMEIRFLSGPLSPENITFTMLDETYFEDKGNKFYPGQNTGVYYEASHYAVLHSGNLINGSVVPLEAEFIRMYLEAWGTVRNNYIQRQINKLIGTETDWVCDGRTVLQTRLTDIVRLSHESSNRLWLEPEKMMGIIQAREGDPDEWVGQMVESPDPAIYLGFCGWGPLSIEEHRSTYYRYVFRFEILEQD